MGARGRDWTLRLPVIRLRPRTFQKAARKAAKPKHTQAGHGRAHRKIIFGHELPVHGGFRGDCDQLSARKPKESSRTSAEGALNSHRVDGYRNGARCV